MRRMLQPPAPISLPIRLGSTVSVPVKRFEVLFERASEAILEIVVEVKIEVFDCVVILISIGELIKCWKIEG